MSKIYEADSFKKTGGTGSQYLMADGTISTGPSGGVDVGTGTANKVAKFSDSDTITDSIITDDGTSVGIGVSGSSAKLHVKSSNSGASTHSGTLIVEAGSAPSIQLLSANTQTQSIKFGDPQDGDAGAISYSHGTNEMQFRVNGGSKVTIDSGGQMGIGTTDPDVMLDVSTSTYSNAFVPIQDLKYSTFDVMKLGFTGATGSIRKGTIDTASYAFSINTGDGSERLVIDTSGDVVIGGNITAASLIKSGGTSSQFLKADGSVDSSTYLTGSLPTDFVSAASGGTFNGALTIDSATDTILKLNSTDNNAIYVTYSRSDDRHAYVGFGGSSDNFTIMSEETGGQIILGTASTTRVVIDDDGHVNVRERLGIGGDFTPQKVLHLKNTAPVFRFEDSDITGGYLDMIKSSRNMRFDLEQDDATSATNFNFRIGGTTHLYMKNNFVGIMNDAPSEALDVTGNVSATSFIKSGGTSAQFLKADGSVDTNTYAVGTMPTDFVSAAGGGTFEGDITADAFIVAGGSSSRFLKADGSTDANTYMTGAGTSGNIAIFDTTNGLIDNSDFSFNFITSKVTMGADLDVVGNITAGVIQADGWNYVPQTFQSNFVHTGGNSYMNLPFNSLSDASSGGEQHFIVTPYSGYVHSVAFKNTATGNTMTATNMNFRILVNGTTIYTSSSQTFTAAQRTYKGWVLTSTDALFNSGNDLRFQFRCTSGLWQDTCAVVVLKCII